MASNSSGGGSGNSREARRRKILDRGGDPLALISGQIQMLPSQPPDCDFPSQPLDSHRPDAPPLPDVSAAVSPDVVGGASGSSLSNIDPAMNSSHGRGSSVEPPLRNHKTSVEHSEAPGPDARCSARFRANTKASVAPTSEVSRSVESFPVSPMDQKSTIYASVAEQPSQPQTLQKIFVNPS